MAVDRDERDTGPLVPDRGAGRQQSHRVLPQHAVQALLAGAAAPQCGLGRRTPASAPAEFAAWLAFQEAVDREDGVVPRRHRELISVAVALVTQCSYCLDVHTAAARRHGVSAQELAETAFVTASVRAGGTLAHALLADRLHEQHGRAGRAGAHGHAGTTAHG